MDGGLIDGLPVADFLHQDFQSGEVVLSDETDTDRFLLVLSGALHDPCRRRFYGPGQVLQPIEFFASERYRDQIIARRPSRVLVIPRGALRNLLDSQSPLTWVLARSVAMERLAAAMDGARS